MGTLKSGSPMTESFARTVKIENIHDLDLFFGPIKESYRTDSLFFREVKGGEAFVADTGRKRTSIISRMLY